MAALKVLRFRRGVLISVSERPLFKGRTLPLTH